MNYFHNNSRNTLLSRKINFQLINEEESQMMIVPNERTNEKTRRNKNSRKTTKKFMKRIKKE
jgi:hypothetical protein